MKAVKFILFLLIFVLIIDRTLSSMIFSVHQKTFTGQTGGKVNNLFKNYEQVNLLALGNSRCAQHVIPSKISDNAFNLSHNGLSLIFHTGMVDQVLSNSNLQIDTILLHIEPYEAFGANNADIRDIQFLSYYHGKNSWITEKINNISRFEYIKYALSSYRWNGKVLSIINNWRKSRFESIPLRGYKPTVYNPRDSLRLEKTSLKVGKIRERKTVINKNFRSYLSHIKNITNSKGIKLYLFTSPTYFENDFFSETAILEDYLDSVNIDFLNYTSIKYQLIFESKTLWKDNFHLNNEGAEILTKLLKKDLLNSYTY